LNTKGNHKLFSEVIDTAHRNGVDIESIIDWRESFASVYCEGLRRQEPERSARLELVGSLTAGLAHDYANTFQSLLLRLEILRTKSAVSIGDLNCLGLQLQGAAQRADQLNDFIKGDALVRFTSVDLRQTIKEAIELLRWGKAQNGNGVSPSRIECELPHLPHIVGPVGEVMYLFVNLLKNACEAMPTGGTITITGRVANGHIFIDIADQGTGIPEELLTRIFGQFVTTKHAGTGLGLWMARGLMRRLGGDIAAENQSQGGALFTLTFPMEYSRPDLAIAS
jgi:signal transduction histidine kinase